MREGILLVWYIVKLILNRVGVIFSGIMWYVKCGFLMVFVKYNDYCGVDDSKGYDIVNY